MLGTYSMAINRVFTLRQNSLKFFMAIVLPLLVVTGCGESADAPKAEPEGSSEVSDAGAAETTDSKGEAEKAAETAEVVESSEICSILGCSDTKGWIPKVVADLGLQRGMSLEEADAILPGAKAIDDNGFSVVEVKDIPGLKGYKLFFLQLEGQPRTLYTLKLQFETRLKTEYTFEELIAEFSKKYGDHKEDTATDTSVIWSNTNLGKIAQLSSIGSDLEFEIELLER